jgi:hypothetical protein
VDHFEVFRLLYFGPLGGRPFFIIILDHEVFCIYFFDRRICSMKALFIRVKGFTPELYQQRLLK